MAKVSGEKSYSRLFASVYKVKEIYAIQSYREYTNNIFVHEIPLQNPFSFPRPSIYNTSENPISSRNNVGYYWEKSIRTISNAHMLAYYSSMFSSQNNIDKKTGLPVRCVAKALIWGIETP